MSIAMPRSDEERLDLSGMQIGELRPEQLGGMRSLRTLVLRHNTLAGLPRLACLPHLESLDLSHNELAELGADALSGCARLRWLDCGHNRLRALPALAGCWQLRALRLDRNRIGSLEAAPRALPLSLAQLSLRENALASPQQLRFLACLPQLASLELAPCPLSASAQQRAAGLAPLLAFLLPALAALDRTAVGEAERAAAARLFADLRGGSGGNGAHGGPANCALDPLLLALLRPPAADEELWAHLRAHAHAAEAAAGSGVPAASAARAAAAAHSGAQPQPLPQRPQHGAPHEPPSGWARGDQGEQPHEGTPPHRNGVDAAGDTSWRARAGGASELGGARVAVPPSAEQLVAMRAELDELRAALALLAPPRGLRRAGASARAARANGRLLGAGGEAAADGSEPSTVGSAQRELPTLQAVACRLAPVQPASAAGVAAAGGGWGAASRLQAAARGRIVRRALSVALRWRRATVALQAAWRGRAARAAAAAALCAPAVLRARLDGAEGCIRELRAELEAQRLLSAAQGDALRLLWAQLAQMLPAD